MGLNILRDYVLSNEKVFYSKEVVYGDIKLHMYEIAYIYKSNEVTFCPGGQGDHIWS